MEAGRKPRGCQRCQPVRSDEQLATRDRMMRMESSNGRDQIHRRRPSLQQLVDLLQIVGALCIIISLLVPAEKVRQNTKGTSFGDVPGADWAVGGATAVVSGIHGRCAAIPSTIAPEVGSGTLAFLSSEVSVRPPPQQRLRAAAGDGGGDDSHGHGPPHAPPPRPSGVSAFAHSF